MWWVLLDAFSLSLSLLVFHRQRMRDDLWNYQGERHSDGTFEYVTLTIFVLWQAMLTGGFMESKGGEIQFPEIKASVLEKVIQYMYYKVRSRRITTSSLQLQLTSDSLPG